MLFANETPAKQCEVLMKHGNADNEKDYVTDVNASSEENNPRHRIKFRNAVVAIAKQTSEVQATTTKKAAAATMASFEL